MSYITADTSQLVLGTCDEAVTYVRDAICRGTGGRLVLMDPDRRRTLRPASSTESTVVLSAQPSGWLRRGHHRRPTSAVALADALCLACQVDGRRVFLIGGAAGGHGMPSGAQRAAAVLGLRYRGLRIVGTESPAPSAESAESGAWAALVAQAVEAKPDLVVVALATVGLRPMSEAWLAQERLIAELRANLPGAWIFGSTGLLDAVVGDAIKRERGPVARLLNR